MSPVRIASIAVVGLALSTLGAAEPLKPTSTPADEVKVLKSKIASQEIQIRQLQAQLHDAQSHADVMDKFLEVLQKAGAGRQPVQPGNTEPKTLPPGWNQRNFNGMSFYLVPCTVTDDAPAKAPVTRSK